MGIEGIVELVGDAHPTISLHYNHPFYNEKPIAI
jgi:hypothetical protein